MRVTFSLPIFLPMPSPIIDTILQNLPLRKPVDKVISSTRAGSELRGFIQKFNPFVDDVQAAIADLDDRVTDATSTTINMDLAELNLPPGIQSEVHLHVTNLTIGNPEGGDGGSNGGNNGANPVPSIPPLTEVWPNYQNFYIDATNGNDANTGLTFASPVQTWGKLREIIAAKRIPTTGAYIKIEGTLQAPLDCSGIVGVADGECQLEFSHNGNPETAIIASPTNSFCNVVEGSKGLKLRFSNLKLHAKTRLIFSGLKVQFNNTEFVSFTSSDQYFVAFYNCDFDFYSVKLNAAQKPQPSWAYYPFMPCFLSESSRGYVDQLQAIDYANPGNANWFSTIFEAKKGEITLGQDVGASAGFKISFYAQNGQGGKILPRVLADGNVLVEDSANEPIGSMVSLGNATNGSYYLANESVAKLRGILVWLNSGSATLQVRGKGYLLNNQALGSPISVGANSFGSEQFFPIDTSSHLSKVGSLHQLYVEVSNANSVQGLTVQPVWK